MPTLQDFLNQGLQAFLPSSLQGANTLTGLPRGVEQIGGAASLIAGLRDQPTVEVPEFRSFASPEGTAAKGFLRRGFEAPVNPLAPGGIYEQYLPIIRRQEEELLEGLGNKFSAAFPANVGIQGPEVLATRRLGEEFLQSRQKLIADLTRENAERQRLMATSLAGLENTGQGFGFEAALEAARQSAEAERQRNANLAALGISLLTDRTGQQGQQQTINIGGQSFAVDAQGRLVPTSARGLVGGAAPIMGTDGASLEIPGAGGASQLINDLASAVISANTEGNLGPLTALIRSGVLAGTPFPFGIEASTPAGQVIQQGINAGLVESPAAELIGGPSAGAGAGGQAVGGLLGKQMAAGAGSQALALGATAIGSGVAGYHVGKAVGDAIERPNTSATTFKTAAGGAVSGAAAGAAVGAVLLDGPGALIGAFVGGISGGIAGSGAEGRREDAQREAEAQSTGASRPRAMQMLQDMEANAAQLPQARAVAAQIEPGVAALIASNDPVVRQVIDGLRALYPQAGGNPFTTSSGVPLPPTGIGGNGSQEHPHATFLLSKLVDTAFQTNPGVEANRSNPESVIGRLFSEETGKFTSAFESIQDSARKQATARQLYAQLLQRLGA